MAFKGRSGSEALLESRSQDDTGNQVVAFGRTVTIRNIQMLSLSYFIYLSCGHKSGTALKIQMVRWRWRCWQCWRPRRIYWDWQVLADADHDDEWDLAIAIAEPWPELIIQSSLSFMTRSNVLFSLTWLHHLKTRSHLTLESVWRCCRHHDLGCPQKIEPGETKGGITNKRCRVFVTVLKILA